MFKTKKERQRRIVRRGAPIQDQQYSIASVTHILVRVNTIGRVCGRHRFELVISKCPFCGFQHIHGGGSGPEPDGGHRLAHCGHGRDYVLILPDGDQGGTT